MRARTDAEWIEELRKAHALRAAFFVAIDAELRREVGAEGAARLIGRACRAMGLAKRERYLGYLGGEASPAAFCSCLATHSDLVAELFQMSVGPVEGEGAAEEAEVQLGRCVLLDGWSAMGLGPAEQARLCAAAREVDHGTLEGLGLQGEFVELASEGGACCRLRVRRR